MVKACRAVSGSFATLATTPSQLPPCRGLPSFATVRDGQAVAATRRVTPTRLMKKGCPLPTGRDASGYHFILSECPELLIH